MKGYRTAVERLWRDAGCSPARPGKGSYAIWFSPKSQRHFTVAATIKSRHTANKILKQAGLVKAF